MNFPRPLASLTRFGWAILTWNLFVVAGGLIGNRTCTTDASEGFVQCLEADESFIVSGALIWIAVNSLLATAAYVFSGTTSWTHRRANAITLVGGFALGGVGLLLILVLEKVADILS